MFYLYAPSVPQGLAEGGRSATFSIKKECISWTGQREHVHTSQWPETREGWEK